MKGIKSVIWSNYNHNLEDWEDYLENAYPEVTDEYEKYHIIEEANNRLLEDEIDNLDYSLPTEIIIIGVSTPSEMSFVSTSIPSIPGILMSQKMASNFSFSAFSQAMVPFSAVPALTSTCADLL